jgi:hypothetical protein
MSKNSSDSLPLVGSNRARRRGEEWTRKHLLLSRNRMKEMEKMVKYINSSQILFRLRLSRSPSFPFFGALRRRAAKGDQSSFTSKRLDGGLGRPSTSEKFFLSYNFSNRLNV